MPDLPSRPLWQRALAESALIIASVFVAIALEGMWSDRELHRAAVAGVEHVMADMQRDSADLDIIIAEQEHLAQDYLILAEWLERREPPGDSVSALLGHIAYSSRTLFPSRGAWEALQSEGLLRAIGDRALVGLLADFYGIRSTRVDYNNALYDAAHQQLSYEDASVAWDFAADRWLTSEPAARASLPNRARYLKAVWTDFYIELMAEYVVAQAEALAAVRDYLDRES